MSEEAEKKSDEEKKGKESNTLGQDDISKLLDEMQGEENSSETEDQAEKTPDDEKKQDSDQKKDDQSEGKESNTLGQDDISKLLDEMQGEEKSSESEDKAEKTPDDEEKQDSDQKKDDQSESKESNTLGQDDISKLLNKVQSEEKSSKTEETEDTTEQVEKDNEGKKNAESEMPEDEKTQSVESNNKENGVEEKAGTQEPDVKIDEEGKKSEEEIDEKDKREERDDEDNGSFEGLDSDDEIEIDGDPENETDKGDNEDKNNKSKKNNEDKDKRRKKDTGGEQTVILKEVKKRSKGKKFKLLLSCISLVVIIAVLFGVYVFFIKSGTDNIKAEESFQPGQMAKPGNKYSDEQTRQQIKVYETKDILLSDSIVAKLEEITKLRNELLAKEREIDYLIRNYKNGISEVENEILREKLNSRINSFSDAINNKKIEFGMMAIQRRLAYIEKIDQPYRWLNHGIEELLYLKRKIEIDARISSVISGIDMDKMIQEIDIMIQSYRTGIEKLRIEMKNIKPISLEKIWESIIDKDKFTVGNNKKTDKPVGIYKPALLNEEKYNRIIWKEICSGNFKRKNEMTRVSTGAAKCLSKWKQSDLFLNGISELSPEVTRHLLKWKGNWICLNGVKKLSPEAAKHLFKWKGNWISLNGISEISYGFLSCLPQWQGKQLELMGLKYKRGEDGRAGLKSLARWEKSGGKLYIPVQIRKVMKRI